MSYKFSILVTCLVVNIKLGNFLVILLREF